MDLDGTVIIGGNTRIIAPQILRHALVIPSELILKKDARSMNALASALTVIFASYRRTKAGEVDQEKSLALASLVVREVPNPRRILYLSSDHVFSGERGSYCASDVPDPVSAYGVMKAGQEYIFRDGVILRFTVLGPSFSMRALMLEKVRNEHFFITYPYAYFSPVCSWSVNDVLVDHQNGRMAPGIYHLASERISKAKLVRILSSRLNAFVETRDELGALADHSLISSPNLLRTIDDEIGRAIGVGDRNHEKKLCRNKSF